MTGTRGTQTEGSIRDTDTTVKCPNVIPYLCPNMGKPCNMQFLDSIQSTLDFVNGDPEFLG